MGVRTSGFFGGGKYINKFWDLQNVRCNGEFIQVGFDSVGEFRVIIIIGIAHICWILPLYNMITITL